MLCINYQQCALWSKPRFTHNIWRRTLPLYVWNSRLELLILKVPSRTYDASKYIVFQALFTFQWGRLRQRMLCEKRRRDKKQYILCLRRITVWCWIVLLRILGYIWCVSQFTYNSHVIIQQINKERTIYSYNHLHCNMRSLI